MYGDTITESMRYAIEETNRRRKYQLKYNKENGITPKALKGNKGRLIEEKRTAKTLR